MPRSTSIPRPSSTSRPITQEEERQLAVEKRIRALELALRDAETRAESAKLELDLSAVGRRAKTRGAG